METNTAAQPDVAKSKLLPVQQNRLLEYDRSFRLSPKSISLYLILITVFLIISHILAVYLEGSLPEASKLRRVIVSYFHFGLEANFPTYFSALLLLLSSIISFCIYKIDQQENNRKNLKYWLSLAVILLFLSADEAVQIHEQLMSVTHYMIPDLSGVFSSAWVIPYAFLSLFIAFYFLKFVFALPTKTRNLIILAGFVFLCGALGLEMAEGYLYAEYGVQHFLFVLNILLQEFLEMAGMVIFIYTLLDYISMRFKSVKVTVI